VRGSSAAAPALLPLCAMCSKGCLAESVASFEGPPKNGEIALWPNTRVVKCKYRRAAARRNAPKQPRVIRVHSGVYLPKCIIPEVYLG